MDNYTMNQTPNQNYVQPMQQVYTQPYAQGPIAQPQVNEADFDEYEKEMFSQQQTQVYVPNKNVFRIAAVVSYIIGFFYWKYVFGTAPTNYKLFENNVGLPYFIFGIAFVVGCEAFAHFTGSSFAELKKKNSSVLEGVIFMVCVLLQSVALLLWGYREDTFATVFQVIMWHLTIVYYVLARCGTLTAGKSGILLPLDFLEGLMIVPFGNFALRIETLFKKGDMKEEVPEGTPEKKFKFTLRGTVTVIFSVIVALIVCLYALSQLSAVSDTFGNLNDSISKAFKALVGEDIATWFFTNLFNFAVSLPFGCFLFGLVAGSLKKKKPEISEACFNHYTKGFHQLPAYSAYIIIGSICVLYTIFFGTALYDFINNQGLFAATAHEASVRAVDSFWSLIKVVLLNFAIMAGSCLFSKKALWEQKSTRIIATLLFVFALGFALLGLYNLCAVYMGVYGFTAKRVLSTWVEGNVIVWCVLMITRLYKKIPAAQIGIILGAISFSVVMCAKF